jgi:hypothetical protein
MFTEKSPVIKFLIVLLVFTGTLIFSVYTIKLIDLQSVLLQHVLILFLITWSHIFCAFIFFQIYKYFRFHHGFYLKRRFESEKYFTALGVPTFRVLLINSFFKHLNRRVCLKGKGEDRFLKFIEETKQSETSHFISFVGTMIFQFVLLCEGAFVLHSFLLIFNLLFNVYPILLQRMNRFSVEKRMESTNSII